MQEIKLIDLSEIALPNWLPNNYIQAIADAITSTGFVPPIVCVDDELITPDVVAALRTIKARNDQYEPDGIVRPAPFIPAGVAVQDGRWLVKVDRRKSKVQTKVKVEHHYHDDWYHHVRPYYGWRDSFWSYTSGNILTADNASISANYQAWNAVDPLQLSMEHHNTPNVYSLTSGETSSVEPSAKHAWKRQINAKYKRSDRAHGKTWKHRMKLSNHNQHQFRRWLWDALRVKSPTETGYGVAYEWNKTQMKR